MTHFVLSLISFVLSFTSPCPYEDSDGCYWNAQARGNGQGTSFISYNDTVYPLP